MNKALRTAAATLLIVATLALSSCAAVMAPTWSDARLASSSERELVEHWSSARLYGAPKEARRCAEAFAARHDPSTWPAEERALAEARKVAAGMRERSVLWAWGPPAMIEGASDSPYGRQATWRYGYDPYATRVYFRDGVVTWWHRDEGR